MCVLCGQSNSPYGTLIELMTRPFDDALSLGFVTRFLNRENNRNTVAFVQAVMPRTPTHPLAVLAKVGLDQAINSPLGTATFFTWTQLLRGTPERALPEIQEKLWPTTQTGWRLWPAAQAVNFFMVPVQYRIVFINLVAIVWTTILSSAGN
jgi:hypothetical protein